jgi:hypothetical protein
MKYSLEFHDYSVAIAAYGKLLEALTAVPQREESPARSGFLAAFKLSPEPSAAF